MKGLAFNIRLPIVGPDRDMCLTAQVPGSHSPDGRPGASPTAVRTCVLYGAHCRMLLRADPTIILICFVWRSSPGAGGVPQERLEMLVELEADDLAAR